MRALHDARRFDGVDDVNWLYRFRDRENVLLYVGIAANPAARAYAHHASAWWRFVDSIDLTWVPGRDLTEWLEREFIVEETPLFNVVHSPDIDDARVIEYAASREAWDLVDALIKAGVPERGDM